MLINVQNYTLSQIVDRNDDNEIIFVLSLSQIVKQNNNRKIYFYLFFLNLSHFITGIHK